MSTLCEHLAYEIDAAHRTVTIVYIGQLSDDEVVDFYAGLVGTRSEATLYDYLLDMRYTNWIATPIVVDRISRVFEDSLPALQCRHVAVVRKSSAAIVKAQETLLGQASDRRVVRYFSAIDAARDWLRTPRH